MGNIFLWLKSIISELAIFFVNIFKNNFLFFNHFYALCKFCSFLAAQNIEKLKRTNGFTIFPWKTRKFPTKKSFFCAKHLLPDRVTIGESWVRWKKAQIYMSATSLILLLKSFYPLGFYLNDLHHFNYVPLNFTGKVWVFTLTMKNGKRRCTQN